MATLNTVQLANGHITISLLVQFYVPLVFSSTIESHYFQHIYDEFYAIADLLSYDNLLKKTLDMTDEVFVRVFCIENPAVVLYFVHYIWIYVCNAFYFKLFICCRYGAQIDWNSDRDVWWHDEVANQSTECEPEWLEAEDPLFILYTRLIFLNRLV